MKAGNLSQKITKAALTGMLTLSAGHCFAQHDSRVVHIANIVVDAAQLDNYRVAVKEIGETSLREEPGVLMLFSVADKAQPNHITVFEIYADSAAYAAHLQTAHFKKYKSITAGMVKSLQLVDVAPIYTGIKPLK